MAGNVSQTNLDSRACKTVEISWTLFLQMRNADMEAKLLRDETITLLSSIHAALSFAFFVQTG